MVTGGPARVGLVSLVGLAIVLIAVSRVGLKPGQQFSGQQGAGPADPSEYARVGETVKLQGWEVTLLDVGPYERFSTGQPPSSPSGGVLVVANMRIRNIQNRPSGLGPENFVLKAGDGREFRSAAQTGSLQDGLATRVTVQSDQTIDVRVAFEVPHDARDLVLEALEIEFSVPIAGR